MVFMLQVTLNTSVDPEQKCAADVSMVRVQQQTSERCITWTHLLSAARQPGPLHVQ